MNDDNFSASKPRPTATEEKPDFRFDRYENDSDNYPSVNPPFPANRERYERYHRMDGGSSSGGGGTHDEKHLDQLAMGFKIYAAITAVFSCIPFFHLFLGIMMVTGGLDGGTNPPPAFVGWMFIVIAVVFITLGWAMAACNFYAGRFLKERRNHTFCFVMSCINCMSMPLGTILGVFGIIVLSRDSVKQLFQDKDAGAY
jgi:hypothetical protein